MREFVDLDTFKAEWEVKYDNPMRVGGCISNKEGSIID